MSIWCVFSNIEYEGSFFVAAFLSKDLAEDYIKKFCHDNAHCEYDAQEVWLHDALPEKEIY